MAADQPKRNVLVRGFVGSNGLYPVWRFVLFAAGIVVVARILSGPVFLFFAHAFGINVKVLTPQLLILSESLNLATVLVVTGVAAWLEHRRIDSYGMPVGQAFGRHFWEGAVLGLVTILFVGGAMIAAGGMRIHGFALHGSDAIKFPVLWLVTMVLVGLSEEYVFRGYALQSLSRGFGFRPAALVTTALFAGAHVSKPHENAIDIGMIFVLGLLLCLTLLRTGSLWLAVGWHASFDFGQFFLIGTKNGGDVPVGHLFDVSFPGPAWINGGELGTEASLFMIPMIVVFFFYIAWRYPKGRAAEPVPAATLPR
jgi:membrane protease YdiL (CAAX protease family)